MSQWSPEQADFMFAMLDQFERAAVGIFSEELRIIYLNSVVCDWWGFRLEDVKGKHWDEVFPPFTPAMEIFKQVLREERSHLSYKWYELTHPRTKEVHHWCSDYFFLRLPDGRKAVGLRSRDVTVEVALERGKEREHETLLNVLRNIPSACSLTAKDAHGRMFIALSNAMNDEWAGKGPLTGRYADELFPELREQRFPQLDPAEGDAFAAIERVFETGKGFAADGVPFLILNNEGKPQTLILNTRVIPLFDDNGRVCYVLVFSVNVTKETEALNALEETKRSLEAVVRSRDDFLSVASHELRTPISTITLAVDALARAVPLVQEEAVRKKLDKLYATLNRQSLRLVELVDDLLDVSRLQAGKTNDLHPSKFDLADVVRELVGKLSDCADQAKCRWALDLASAEGIWDAPCVVKIVTNYLSNAIKYGAGSLIDVRTFKQNKMIVLTVRDYGPGVKEEDQARIFKKFERAVPVGTQKGLGLGLWIAARAAHQIGASLNVRTPEDRGGGTQFELYLPTGVE